MLDFSRERRAPRNRRTLRNFGICFIRGVFWVTRTENTNTIRVNRINELRPEWKFSFAIIYSRSRRFNRNFPRCRCVRPTSTTRPAHTKRFPSGFVFFFSIILIFFFLCFFLTDRLFRNALVEIIIIRRIRRALVVSGREPRRVRGTARN